MAIAIPPPEIQPFKDSVLAYLSEQTNVAQFVSFAPNLTQRHSRLLGVAHDVTARPFEHAISAILESSAEHCVNIRTFVPGGPPITEFVYGLKSAGAVCENVTRLASQGWFTIVNETLTMGPGSIGGVVFSDLVEFAPSDTPRCVERPDAARLPRAEGLRLLELVLGVPIDLGCGTDLRVEFTLHPMRCGVRDEHMVIWEVEAMEPVVYGPTPDWPNRFSRDVGDKSYGLALAHLFGLPVPRSTVIARKYPPWTFGMPTGTQEAWLRPSPSEPIPGAIRTSRGWTDLFTEIEELGPLKASVMSLVVQEGVDADFSGALLPSVGEKVIIEGVRGLGQRFMVGEDAPQELPPEVIRSVEELNARAVRCFGPVRVEWAYEARNGCAWVLQIQPMLSMSTGQIIYPGAPRAEHRFKVANGLEALRTLISVIAESGDGVVLVGSVGITSHFGDLLRRAHIPSRMEADRET